jgi:hypothetical protein
LTFKNKAGKKKRKERKKADGDGGEEAERE